MQDMPPKSQTPLDRRIVRTQRLLRQALLDLINEKDYAHITVDEICRRADVSRGAFYLHYKDKEELLFDYFTELVQERMARFATFPLGMLAGEEQGGGGLALEFDGPIVGVFAHAAEHAAVYRLALKGEGAVRMTGRVRQMIVQALDELLHVKLREAGREPSPIPLELAAQALVSAFLAGLAWWLEQDMPYPPQKMAEMFREMFMPSLRIALGFV